MRSKVSAIILTAYATTAYAVIERGQDITLTGVQNALPTSILPSYISVPGTVVLAIGVASALVSAASELATDTAFQSAVPSLEAELATKRFFLLVRVRYQQL